MRIGIIGTRGIPNNYGGFEQFAEHLAMALVQKGHSVSVYNSHNHPYRESQWKGVQIINCKDPEHRLGTIGQFIYDYHCLADAKLRSFDILLHLGYTSNSIWHWKWPRKQVNIVNMDGLEWKRTKYNMLTRRFLKYAEKLAALHADKLIADSRGIQEYLRKVYGKEAVYIPYGAGEPEEFDASVLQDFGLEAGRYYILIARMEPENNIEMVINGYLASEKKYPLVLIGNTDNKFGKYLTGTYKHEGLKFPGAVFDWRAINALRHYSAVYFHGHSVGGTNPSLLEAMAAGCNIVSHDNIFNRAVLGDDAEYFMSESDVLKILNGGTGQETISVRKNNNLKKIITEFNWEKIVDEYEKLFLQSLKSRQDTV